QRLHPHIRRLHAVLRQPRPQVRPPYLRSHSPPFFRPTLPAALRPRVIRHQPLLPTFILPRHHHRFPHPRVFRQLRFDLSQLDPIFSDLHLLVVTPTQLNVPFTMTPSLVPLPFHPPPHHLHIWVLN